MNTRQRLKELQAKRYRERISEPPKPETNPEILKIKEDVSRKPLSAVIYLVCKISNQEGLTSTDRTLEMLGVFGPRNCNPNWAWNKRNAKKRNRR